MEVVVRGDDVAGAAAAVRQELSAVDAACNRFRPDSELSVVNADASGRPTAVSPVFARYLAAALAMAEATDGLVDPTLGRALRQLGYDDDIATVRATQRPVSAPVSGSGTGWVASRRADWRDVAIDERTDSPGAWLHLPAGVELDLGATAKALAADRAAEAAHRATGRAVLVSLGGDLAMAGSGNEPWLVGVSETAETDPAAADQVLAGDGGLATSTTLARRWTTAQGGFHHLLDPITGLPVREYWRTVTVSAESCLQANAASTAAVVLGRGAAGWLTDRELSARLVRDDGLVVTTPGWPATDHTVAVA